MLLVGENGSGKTTILRMVYETLACKWALLSLEEFDYIELVFEDAVSVKIEKSKLRIAKELFVSPDSSLMRELPVPIRRSLIERSDISGREISYDQILEAIDEYSPYRMKNRVFMEEHAIEIAKTGMDDVEYFIQMTIDDIKRKADISASRLNYQYFNGIFKKVSDTVNYDPSILTPDEIQNVFGSLNADMLSPEDSVQIMNRCPKASNIRANCLLLLLNAS